MQESNMTEQDWANHLAQWEESFSVPPVKSTVNHTPKAGPEHQLIDIIRVERMSVKAKFYVTEDNISGVYGFWCPKGIVKKEPPGKVELPDWFEPKIIEFL